MSDFFDSLTEREKVIYNQGVVDRENGMKEFWEALKQKAQIHKELCNWFQDQNLCDHCKKWIKDWADSQ